MRPVTTGKYPRNWFVKVGFVCHTVPTILEKSVKTAVVYYSYDGNSALAARALKSALQADIFQIETQDEKKRGGLAKYIWGGKQVFSHVKPALKPLAFDPASYDLVIIGGPVWAGAPAPALVSWLDAAKLKDKKTAFFLCHGGGKGHAVDKLKALLPGNTIAGEIDFVNLKKQAGNGELELRIADWIKTLGAAGGHPGGQKQ
jgi:flavodoxin